MNTNSSHGLPANASDLMCWHIVVSGFVQGVGFRPFVFHLANQLNIKGYVLNNAGQVTIEAEASQPTLERFCELLIENSPRNAQPVIDSIIETALQNYGFFEIQPSRDLKQSDVHMLADLPVCDQCLEELFDKNNRRYLYSFINCCQCGPRYSIIKALPYDRQNTSMQNFSFCSECEHEYTSTEDRRFHAEPIACEHCGPLLTYVENSNNVCGNKLALEACINALQQGQIVAVKNIAGYHLMCDATSPQAIAKLRKRKQRPDKPFAILIDKNSISHYADVTQSQLELLETTIRPVVLLKRKQQTILVDHLADNLAPGLNRLGIMLPNNPLQHLISVFFKKPLVSTSANISAEPIITDNAEATKRLSNICDAFLHHNRDIVRPTDDPVMMKSHLGTHLLRTGRGVSPSEFVLPFTLDKPVLALGGHSKNTIALAWNNRLVLSSHNGDLSDWRSYQVYKQRIVDLQALYQVQAEQILCDAHPGYASSHWASQSALPVTKILHHHAHASSVYLDHPEVKQWLMFSWDGVGFGADDGDDIKLWGGETFIGRPGNWQRVASFLPFKLPGGEKAAREAWRVSASLCWHSHEDYEPIDEHTEENLQCLKTLWDKKINSPQSSAVGRLFSGAAAMLGLVEHESFEGHGPMLLESLASTEEADALELPVECDVNGVQRIDWRPLVHMLKNKDLSKAYRARCFHESLAESVARLCRQFNIQGVDMAVGLSGGVFQNTLLIQLIKKRLASIGCNVFMPESVPVNDGGLSAGQVIEYYFQ